MNLQIGLSLDLMSISNSHHIMKVTVVMNHIPFLKNGVTMMFIMTKDEEGVEEDGDSPEVHGEVMGLETEEEGSEIEAGVSEALGNTTNLDMKEK